jgi:hypothetical protein
LEQLFEGHGTAADTKFCMYMMRNNGTNLLTPEQLMGLAFKEQQTDLQFFISSPK